MNTKTILALSIGPILNLACAFSVITEVFPVLKRDVVDVGTDPDANGRLAFDQTSIFTVTESIIDPTSLDVGCTGY